MKRIYLFTLFFVFVLCVSPAFSFSSKPADETTFTGNIFYGNMPSLKQPDASTAKPDNKLANTRYWLKLDKPLVFAPGSKSQRAVKNITLLIPEDLREKAKLSINRHVEVTGFIECEMHYTP